MKYFSILCGLIWVEGSAKLRLLYSFHVCGHFMLNGGTMYVLYAVQLDVFEAIQLLNIRI